MIGEPTTPAVFWQPTRRVTATESMIGLACMLTASGALFWAAQGLIWIGDHWQ